MAGDVFTNQQISMGCEIGLVFMPLAFGVLKDWTKEEIDNIGCIYARFSDGTFPRSVNGNPMFMTCSFMHKKDWARVVAAIQKAQAAVRDIDV
jgi:hypothetical protein